MTKRLWIVYKKDRMIGCFHSKERATNYIMDLWFDGMEIEDVKIKEVSLDEYKKICYNQIKKER